MMETWNCACETEKKVLEFERERERKRKVSFFSFKKKKRKKKDVKKKVILFSPSKKTPNSHVGEPGVVQGVPDRPHAPVHHVRRRHAVRAGPRLRDGLAAQELDSLVVEDLAVVGDDAVVAVAIVGVERDVGVDLEVRELGLEEADGALDEAVRVEGLLAGRGLEVLGGLLRVFVEFFFPLKRG